MQSTSVAREAYTAKRGERYEIRRPKDSQFATSNDRSVMKTQKEMDYVAKKGYRYNAVKPVESDIWKVINAYICTFNTALASKSYEYLNSGQQSIYTYFSIGDSSKTKKQIEESKRLICKIVL